MFLKPYPDGVFLCALKHNNYWAKKPNDNIKLLFFKVGGTPIFVLDLLKSGNVVGDESFYICDDNFREHS